MSDRKWRGRANKVVSSRRPLALHSAEIMKSCTIEATLPTPSELSALNGVLPKGSKIYLSALPGRSHIELAGIAAATRRSGYEPVPHVAARGFASRDQLADHLSRLRFEADVQTLLVIAGDIDSVRGPFSGALDIIRTDLLQMCGIKEIGISGYPEDHPKIGNDVLSRALTSKIEAASERQLSVHIVSQFCFDSSRIIGWIGSLRAMGINLPIKFGVAGPTRADSLLKFALRCGVRSSFKAVVSGRAAQLLEEMAPDAIIQDVALYKDRNFVDGISPHIYSFGGLGRTVRWAAAHGAWVSSDADAALACRRVEDENFRTL